MDTNETGLVSGIRSLGGKELLVLEIPRSEACKTCKACVPLDGKDSMQSFALNECGAKIGDRVALSPGANRELASALILYGLPLVCFLGGLFLFLLFLPELWACLSALGCSVLCYLAVWLVSRKKDQSKYLPRAVKILKE